MSVQSVQSRQWTPNNEVEGRRLDEQHIFISNAVDPGRYVYDPSVKLVPGNRVLDAGAGTGAWSLDFAKTLPDSIYFDCVDILTEAYPTKYPSNLDFSQGSVTDLPKDWANRFDLVHQRLLNGRLEEPEWYKIALEFFRVLKPGGSVQFFEYDMAGWNKTAHERSFVAILEKLFAKRNLVIDCGLRLPRVLQQVGFVNIHLEILHAAVGKHAGDAGSIGARALSNGFRKFKTYASQLGLTSEQEYNDLVNSLENEWNETVGGRKLPVIIVYAKKPTA